MKVNIDGKSVDILVNGQIQSSTIVKKKLSDKKMSVDEVVRKAKELLEKPDAKD